MPPNRRLCDPCVQITSSARGNLFCTSRSGAKMLVPIEERPVMFTPPFWSRAGKKSSAEV